ncbi:MAG: VWA domain-containing protein [Treponema sp.]|nr:VWA domain-containing protein [Candidatus Treponema equifaecale]
MLSNLSIQRPEAFLLLLAFLPVVGYVIHRFRKLSFTLGGFYGDEKKSKIYRQIKRRIFLRTVFRCFAWLFAVCAFAGFSWGTRNVPVQKSGTTVCLVFDISYSMTARDCDGLTRLEASKIYAQNLISRMEGNSFSAVLAKGDGFVAIPETEDKGAIYSLLENLSPTMISTAGSSLGKGLQSALHSLSLNSANTSYMWIFTDGEETDNLLESALVEAGKYGIPVTFVGFGKETETEIIAGDGHTPVKTSLKAKKLKELSENASKKASLSFSSGARFGKKNFAVYLDSTSAGSAVSLLNQVKIESQESENSLGMNYEVIPVKRHGLFLMLAMLCFIISFIAGEVKINSSKKNAVLASIVFAGLFTSCHQEQKTVLKGSWNWYQGNYRTATAEFLNASYNSEEETMSHQYALFGLASTYISMEQYDAAMDRLGQIRTGSAWVTPELESAVFYNAGIICQRKNDFSEAAEYFKKAILSDSRNTNAKINLELCQRQNQEKNAAQAETEMQKVSEGSDNSSMQNQIFNLIREQDNKQWKKMQSNQKESNVLDY